MGCIHLKRRNLHLFICIHAHHSNSRWMDETLPNETLHHVVIEGLLTCTERDQVEKCVLENLTHLYHTNKPQAFFITCTYFAAHLPKTFNVPLIPLDQLLFEQVATLPAIQFVFTNPATVEPTMERYKVWRKKEQLIKIHIIPAIFQYVKEENWTAYEQTIRQFIMQLPKDSPIAFGQLSMELARRKEDYGCLTVLPQTIKKLKSFAW